MEKITFIIPCYRSENTIEEVVNEIRSTMEMENHYCYNIILVSDCSPDGVYQVIKKLNRNDTRIIGCEFAKNFGQHAALMAGLMMSDGDYVICLDDDGQTPANECMKLIHALDQGFDVAYARYSHKQHSLFRNFGSVVNSKMTEVMLNKPKDLYVSSYFAAKKFVVDEILKYRNSYPYVIGLVLRTTKNITCVDVTHRDRIEGNSGYTIGKLISLWINGFTAFSVKPLRLATYMGIISAILGFIYAIWAVYNRIANPLAPTGWTTIIIILLIIGGMILFVLGLIGEYVGRMYISMNNSPQYVIRDTVGLEHKTGLERKNND